MALPVSCTGPAGAAGAPASVAGSAEAVADGTGAASEAVAEGRTGGGGATSGGVLSPPQCKLFGNACTPEHPVGALMVSSEGACAAYFKYVAHPVEA